MTERSNVLGSPFEPRPDNGQPPISFETRCDHCGETTVVTLPWENARQYLALLEQRLAENMRVLPGTPRAAA